MNNRKVTSYTRSIQNRVHDYEPKSLKVNPEDLDYESLKKMYNRLKAYTKRLRRLQTNTHNQLLYVDRKTNLYQIMRCGTSESIRNRRDRIIKEVKGLSSPTSIMELFRIINPGHSYRTFQRDVRYLFSNGFIDVYTIIGGADGVGGTRSIIKGLK